MLRAKAEPVTVFGDEIRKLGTEMIEIMRKADGCGLAAQQIGETRSICVIEVPPDYDLDDEGKPLNPDLKMPMILINPEISAPSRKTDSRDEGCLSFPGIRGSISRPTGIHVTCQDQDGKKMEMDVRGFAARVIQHEVDHLNGVLFIDRMSAAKRFTLKARLHKLQRGEES